MLETANVWEYLDNIWVLTGLVLVVFAGLLKSISGKKLNSPAVEKLMQKGINYLFILGLVGIVFGFVMPEIRHTKNTAEINQSINDTRG